MTPAPARRWVAPLLFLACLGYAVWAATAGWDNTIIDFIGFRQAQTALTTYFMIGKAPVLAYETPVIGPPWSIPFEFPVYQWIVAALVTAFDWPLDQTGRFVSLLFFLLTMLPAWRILAWLGIAPSHRWLALSLFVVSPFYIFWSRTFLIESTALFFSVSYLALALPCIDDPRPRRIAAAAFVGILAALVKMTTFAAFLPALLLALAAAMLREGRSGFTLSTLLRRAVLVGCVAVLPTLAGVAWTGFADAHKDRNAIGRYLSSTWPGMQKWNFGTFEQRCERKTWGIIFERVDSALGDRWVLFGAAAVMLVLGRRRRAFLGCLLLFPIAPLLFTNLYYYHEYYSYANHVFLLAAVALGLVALLERGGAYQYLAGASLVIFLVVSVWRHQDYYVPIQERNRDELASVGAVVQRVTQPDDVIVVLGCDWSSEVPYSCRRRALAVPVWLDPSIEKVPGYLDLPAPWRAGALVIHTSNHPCKPADVERVIRGAGYEVRLHRADGVFDVYELTRSRSAGLPLSNQESGEQGRDMR